LMHSLQPRSITIRDRKHLPLMQRLQHHELAL
jgi:hypothetical protein